MRAAVLNDVRKTIRAAAQEKLASMRYTKRLIKAATASVISLVQSLNTSLFPQWYSPQHQRWCKLRLRLGRLYVQRSSCGFTAVESNHSAIWVLHGSRAFRMH